MKETERTLEEMEEDYRALCGILLFLSLTRGKAAENGDTKKHELAIADVVKSIKLSRKSEESPLTDL